MKIYHVIVEPGFWDKLGAIGTVVAFLAVAITLVFSYLGQRATRAGQKLIEAGQLQEREIAESTAKRAEAAARVSVEYSERIVAALEQIASSGLAGVAPLPVGVKWELVRAGGDTYRLTNIGEAIAREVEISTDETLHLGDLPDSPVDLGPGEAIVFFGAVDFGTRDLTVTVSWSPEEGGDARKTWRYPLPY